MPEQRMLHPQQSSSRKVSALTDFEYRVWEQTKLSADDFGVLPFNAFQMRSDNTRLRKASEKELTAALNRIAELGLLLVWMDQDEPYACAPVWQTWQTIKWPSRTTYPAPPPEVIAQCDEKTREHFGWHPGGQRVGSRGRGSRSESAPESRPGSSPESRSVSAAEPMQASAAASGGESAPDVPANANANANANAHSGSLQEEGLGETRSRPGSLNRSAAGVTPMEWHRKHASVHVVEFCDWCCLPCDLVDEFARKSPGEFTVNRARVVEWARAIRREWAAQVVPERSYDFWNNRWTETHGSSRPRARAASVDPLAGIKEALRG